jgi:hypothetical protein
LKLNDADRTRMGALMDIALTAQDKRLDALIEELRTGGTLDQTTLIVTSDAPFLLPAAAPEKPAPEKPGVDKPVPEKPPVDKPSKDKEPATTESAEEPLSLPLVIRFAGGYAAGRVVTAMTDPTDVGATVVAAFGGSIVDLAGRDLSTLALDDEPARNLALLSDDGRGYQLSWGDLRLVGSWGKTPQLRQRPSTEDLRAKRPYEYLAAWGLAAEARDRWLTARSKGPGREPATIDAATAAALETWERAR